VHLDVAEVDGALAGGGAAARNASAREKVDHQQGSKREGGGHGHAHGKGLAVVPGPVSGQGARQKGVRSTVSGS
jgi:hypothetical protein